MVNTKINQGFILWLCLFIIIKQNWVKGSLWHVLQEKNKKETMWKESNGVIGIINADLSVLTKTILSSHSLTLQTEELLRVFMLSFSLKTEQWHISGIDAKFMTATKNQMDMGGKSKALEDLWTTYLSQKITACTFTILDHISILAWNERKK